MSETEAHETNGVGVKVGEEELETVEKTIRQLCVRFEKKHDSVDVIKISQVFNGIVKVLFVYFNSTIVTESLTIKLINISPV